MAQWLMKTEPDDYSWDRLIADGGTDWTGVRNYQAALNMRAMKTGDRAFFYRSMVEPAVLGNIFFAANLLAGISALSAAAVAARIGLINTMVFTHIPSNILLMLVPLMPNLPLAITMLLLRFSISQMDVPTRQSYTMAVVDPSERSAAAGVTAIARTLGAALAPGLTGLLIGMPAWINAPFFIAGILKIIYDVTLYRMFITVQPPEEKHA